MIVQHLRILVPNPHPPDVVFVNALQLIYHVVWPSSDTAALFLNIDSTVENLGEHCRPILAMHALSGCDTTSYPIGKGKVSILNPLRLIDVPVHPNPVTKMM